MGLRVTSTESFIKMASCKHRGEYDYSHVEYVRSNEKVKIICKKHGVFEQTPNNHLRSHGCPGCSTDIKKKLFSHTTDDFVKKAKKTHGNFYDYSHVNYTGSYAKVKIVCPHHGEFLQAPSSHLFGANCPKCVHVISKMETEFLDCVGVKDRNFYLPEWKAKPVDGFDAKTNTVYEFLGDYWHGNPTKFDHAAIHPHRKIPFGKIYSETFALFDRIKKKGYNIKYIWETDWTNWNKIDRLPLQEY